LCCPKSIRTVHRMHKDCREQRIADAVKGASHRAPNTRLDGGDEPERGPSFLRAALVHKVARQLGISGKRCRKHNVSPLLKGESPIFVPSFALNRYDISTFDDWQDFLLQELNELSAPADNQYGVVKRTILHASVTCAGAVHKHNEVSRRLASLLIQATFVLYPSRSVMPIWVAMGPVNRPALRVPFIFAEKCHFVANFERNNSRCQVNIVDDQDCLARFKLNDKSLMPIPVVIVRSKTNDRPRSLDLKIALVLIKWWSEPLVTFANGTFGINPRRRSASAECGETKNHDKQSESHMRFVKSFNS